MRIRQAILMLAALSAACHRGADQAIPSPARSAKLVRAAEPISDRYLASLSEGVDEAGARALAARHGGTLLRYHPAPLQVAELALPAGRALGLAEDQAVRLLEEDSRLRMASVGWNLDRIDERVFTPFLGYSPATSGAGVHVYVVDTGVALQHEELAGRADAPFSPLSGDPAGDCNGHGTHLAGLVAGATRGVAAGATIHSIRTLGCAGDGSVSSLVAALDWVRQNHASPAVTLVGVTAGLSPVLEQSIQQLLDAGVVVVGPAGNDAVDACSRLPGAVADALVAGATTLVDEVDEVASFSNRGPCVDLYAPGADVESAWSGVSGYRVASGTSQAAAHVAGAAALFLEARPDATPRIVHDALVGNATLGELAGLDATSANRLLYVGFITPTMGDVTSPTVSISEPAADAQVVGATTIAATAADGGGAIAQVAFYVDGRYVGADADPTGGYSTIWDTLAVGNGPHTIVAKAFDTAGNSADAQLSVTVQNPGNAAWNDALAIPACADAGTRCSSGALLEGRGPVGPEAHAPNTIHALCRDGAAGTYRRDESIEAIEVRSAGTSLAEGVIVDVAVKVWAYPDYGTDRVDLYFAADAGAPAWQYAASAELTGAGEQWAHFSYRLPAFPSEPKGTLQAVRAAIRYGGAPAECTTGPYDDRDDLAFNVQHGTPDLVAPVVSLVAPSSGAQLTAPTALSAVATDDAGEVTRVEFFAGTSQLGTAHARDVDGLFRIVWDVDHVPTGAYSLRAVAYDASGNAGESAPVPVDVVDTVSPAVRIVLPDPGAVVGGTVHLEAAATDNRGVAKVEFRSGTTVLGTATTPPWATDWNTLGLAGPATIVAQAWDVAGNTQTSAPLSVSIDNTPPEASIESPPGGTDVSGVTTIVVVATDNDAIEHVELFVGGAYLDDAAWNATLQRWTLLWKSGTRPNGPVELIAKAFDRAGNWALSAPVTVNVNDTTPPTVVLARPLPGFVHGITPVLALADDEGVITKVRFLLDGQTLEDDPYVPYELAWDTTKVTDGQKLLSAQAWDLGGNLGESGTVSVVVDNHGPASSIVEPTVAVLSGDVRVKVHATDLAGVKDIEIRAGEYVVGLTTTVSGEADAYELYWKTTDYDNRSFDLYAYGRDILDNAATSAFVQVVVSNVTTAEYDATLGAPACKSPAAWCFSGTLLDGAGPSEKNGPNTLGRACPDGSGSQYHASESIDMIKVAAKQGALSPGARVEVTIRSWAYAANEADQIDVYHAADAHAPAWTWLTTLTPVVAGANEHRFELDLSSGPLQVIRANFRFAQAGPDTCSTGDFGDRDDLVFAVGSPVDQLPPTVAVTRPSKGGTVSGDVIVAATASDDVGVARVEFWIDGALHDVDTTWPYETVWNAALVSDGAHTIQARAYDTSGNASTLATASVTVLNVANATFDAALGVPACSAVSSFCDSGSLLEGRGIVGPAPETNAPNTIGGTCLDGTEGLYHVDESLDWMKVSSADGLPLAAGKRARVEARVFAYDAWSDDALDLFYTTTPDDPQWIWLATLQPTHPGPQTLAYEYVLPPGSFHAVRGQYRYMGAPEPCGTGPFDDRDDLAFAVEYSPNAQRDPQLHAPSCSGSSSFCDAGTLLDGRGPLGPESHAPNTIDACADGTLGAYHVDPSVDALLVRTNDGSTLRAGSSARVEVRVYASAQFASERVDLFVTTNANAQVPTWSYVDSLFPSRQGSQVLVGAVPLGPAGRHAVRAHMSKPPPLPDPPPDPLPAPIACGTKSGVAVVDDQDDLAFDVSQ